MTNVVRRRAPVFVGLYLRRCYSHSTHLSRSPVVDLTLRDGIQGDEVIMATDDKLEVLRYLRQAGLKDIEFGAFVKKVPQMEDTLELAEKLTAKKNRRYWALIANRKGYEIAIEKKVKCISIAAAVSNKFALKNIGKSVEDSTEEFTQIVKVAPKTRVYLSCTLGCPFGELITPQKVAELARKYIDAGASEVVPSDTTGMGSIDSVCLTTEALLNGGIPASKISWHFHGRHPDVDLHVNAALRMGIRRFDSSLGNLGGCPFAPAHFGNVSTEKLHYILEQAGIETGINVEYLYKAQAIIDRSLFDKV